MRKLLVFWLVLTTAATAVHGQQAFEIRGVVADTAGSPLTGVSIKLLYDKDSMQVLTDKSGAYRFTQVRNNSFTVIATYSGLRTFSKEYTRTNSSAVFQVPLLVMAPTVGELEAIVIKAVNPMLVKEDTLQFNASAYKVREGAPVEDVIKKLPGVTVDKDGNIEAQGKKVARVRVNGKDFFGGDVQTATQNLPADVIENIQIIDDYGDQANLTGIKDGEPEKIINITVQRNKNRGTFGSAVGAIGNEDRYAGNLFVNNFFDDRQISVLAAINNTNANLFNFNGGGRGGGARGANFGSEGRGGSGGAGITLSQSAGLNFRDKWGQKISVYGSYSFSSRSTHTTGSSFSQDINPQNIRNTQRQSNSENQGVHHRLTWNMEYALDSFTFLKASPYFSYSSSENESWSRSEISRKKYFTLNNNLTRSASQSPNAGGNLLFNHKFSKRGRNFSANLSIDYSDNTGDRYSNGTYQNVDTLSSSTRVLDTLQLQTIGTASRNTRTNARFSFSEPLNEARTTFLEVHYTWNNSATESIREVYDLLDSVSKTGYLNDRQSNHFKYRFTTNRAGISIKGQKAKYHYSIGLQSQPASLAGNSIGKGFSTGYNNINWIPSARLVYTFARNHSLTATLDGSAREPGFLQLQPVADSSNLNNIVVGNPSLRNEFTNNFSVRYHKFDPKGGSSLFVNLSHDRTNNKIVNNRFNNPTGTGRTTTYLNTDGFSGYDGNASFSQPFSNRKYTVGVNMSASYDNNISYTDGLRNKGSNWRLRPGANFRLDLDNKVDLTLRADYTAYHTTTRYATYTNTTKAKSLNLGLNGKNYFGNLTLGYDYSKLINYGFNSSVNSNPSVLNVYAEYRMLKGKMLTLRFQGFDLFNQNLGIMRTVNETTISESRNNRLGRYFLLTANIRLAKFTGRSSFGSRGNYDRSRGNRDE